MRASKLLLALGLTAGILALPNEGVPGQVDHEAGKKPHDKPSPTHDLEWPFGPPLGKHAQTKDKASLTGKPEARAKHDPPIPHHAEVIHPAEKAVHPAGSDDLPQHPPRDKPCNPLDPGCWDKPPSGPNEPRQATEGKSGVDLLPPIEPLSKWHTSPPPKDHHDERSLAAQAMAADDWTHWACTRGVRWTCQYPDFDKRDDQTPIEKYLEACKFARLVCYNGQDNCACDRLENCGKVEASLDDPENPRDIEVHDDFKKCLCSIGYGPLCPPVTPTTTLVVTPSPHVKRDDAPTKVGQVVTHHSSNEGGQEYTVRMSLAQTSPWVQFNTFDQQGTSYTVVLSQMSKHPNLAVQTLIIGDITSERTTRITASPTKFGPLTSMSNAKRGATAMPSSTPLIFMSEAISRLTSAMSASPSLRSQLEHILLPGSTENPFPFTPARREVDQVDTMTILDEHPGHTTLNPEVATQTNHPTTGVTVVEHHGSKLTVSATTDSKGNAILVTQGLASKAKETCTVTLVLDGDKVETIMPSKTGKDMVTETAAVLRLPKSTIEAPIPKIVLSSSAPIIEAPVPKVEIQTHGSTVVKVVTETVTMFARPYTTLHPMEWDPIYAVGWEHVLRMHLDDLKKAYPNARWDDEIRHLAQHLRQRNPTWSKEKSFKHAFILLHQQLGPYEHIPKPTSNEEKITQFIAKFNSSSVPMTAPVQTIGGHVYAIDPLMKYNRYDPRTFAVAPTGSCHHNDDDDDDDDHHDHAYDPIEVHRYNKTECAIEQCMWNYMKPIEITTAMPAAFRDPGNGRMVYDYFTHSTHLDRVHWGTSERHGVYYPTRTAQLKNGTFYIARETPPFMNEEARKRVDFHHAPRCSDVESCHDLCLRHHHDEGMDLGKWWYYALAILGLLLIGLLLLCCLGMCRRRRQRDPERRRSSVSDKLRRKPSEKPQEVVVNQVNGETTDQAGNTIGPGTAPATAVVAGSAAGAAAAAEDRSNGDDGRGTTGRRAEEGRGRVNFADNEKPPGENKPTEDVKPAGEPSVPPAQEPAASPPATETHTTEHAEPTPVPDKDGAGGVGTGRQQPDVGSMRGRRRNRPEGNGIAGLGF